MFSKSLYDLGKSFTYEGRTCGQRMAAMAKVAVEYRRNPGKVYGLWTELDLWGEFLAKSTDRELS